jgi:glycosyltransferase involved in cell wall biosynthesis
MNKLFISDRIKNEKWIYIISLVERSLVFENTLKELYRIKPDILLVFMFESVSPLQDKCNEIGFKTIHIPYKSKKDFLRAGFTIFSIIIREKPDLVHCHLFDASLLGITISKILNVKKRIHTRHHATHHHLYFPHAVKYDRWINKLSTKIIAISQNIKNILIEQEQVNPDKVNIVYHGFNFDVFDSISNEQLDNLRLKYNIPNDVIVLGMVSRYTHWKGIQYVIPAFKELLRSKPNAILVLANAVGDYTIEIQALLSTLPESSYREIKFEHDMPALYKLMDIFLHVPIDAESEAFGQVYVEALAAQLPCIYTLSGIANEFVIDKVNALVVPFMDSDSILSAINLILNDDKFAKEISFNGMNKSRELFSVQASINQTLIAYE